MQGDYQEAQQVENTPMKKEQKENIFKKSMQKLKQAAQLA